MDAVKVIKKSGAPGAVPAVTAYVDEPLLPKVSAEDSGKVIGVNENGELEAVSAGGGGGGIKGTLKLKNSDENTPNFQITAYSTIFSFLDSCDMCATQNYTIPYGSEVTVEVELLRQLEYSTIVTESEDPDNTTQIVGSFNNWDTGAGYFLVTARNSKCVGSDIYHTYLLANGFEISGYRPDFDI